MSRRSSNLGIVQAAGAGRPQRLRLGGEAAGRLAAARRAGRVPPRAGAAGAGPAGPRNSGSRPRRRNCSALAWAARISWRNRARPSAAPGSWSARTSSWRSARSKSPAKHSSSARRTRRRGRRARLHLVRGGGEGLGQAAGLEMLGRRGHADPRLVDRSAASCGLAGRAISVTSRKLDAIWSSWKWGRRWMTQLYRPGRPGSSRTETSTSRSG